MPALVHSLFALARSPQRLALLLAALLTAGATLAQSTQATAPQAAQPATCPPTFAPHIPALAAEQQAALEQLAPLAAACETSAAYHAQRGALLLALQRPTEAAIALEKALLFDPEHPGTQLDYAQALAQTGQRAAARALLRGVLARPDLPAGLRERLAPGLREPAQATDAAVDAAGLLSGAWRWSGQLQAGLGHESNVNNATSSDSLTLILPGGAVTLPLADTERPLASHTRKSAAQAQGVYPLGAGELRLGGALSERKALAHEPASTFWLDASAHYAHPAPGAAAVALGLAAQQLWLASLHAYSSHAVQLRYEPQTPLWGCQWAPQLAQAELRYPASPQLDGVYTHFRLELACASGQGARTLAAYANGQDRARDSARPGADRARQELLLRHERALAGGQLSLWARWHATQDSSPYSPLFGDLKASTHTRWLGLGYWWPAASTGWSYGLELETTSQNSNNSLNNMDNFSAYTGLRWAWQ